MDEERPKLDLNRPSQSQAKPDADYVQQVRQLVEDAFTVSRVIKKTKRNKTIVSGGKVPTKNRKHEVTLMRMTQWPNVVYCVYTDNLDTTECVFHLDLATGEAYGRENTVAFEQKDILKLLKKMRDSALAPKRKAKRRRRKVRNWAIGLTTTAAIVTGVVFLIAALTATTEDPIHSDRIYTAGPQAYQIEWSEQYDHQDVASLKSFGERISGIDGSKEIPTDEPQEVTAPSDSIFDKCDSYARDIKEGQRFKAVYKGQGGDGFTVRFDDRANVIEVCRTGGDSPGFLDSSENEDKIYVQRVPDK